MRSDDATWLWDMLDRHWAGECSAAEEEQIRAYVATRPQLAAAIARVPDQAGAVSVTPPDWSRLRERSVGVRARRSTQRPPWRQVGYGVVGAAALIAILESVTTWRPVRRTASETRTYTTSERQRATVTLGDGTKLVLGPSTTMKIVRHPSTAETMIDMTGQGMFTVPHAARSPFAVRTGTIVTRVLGTAFVVQRYAADRFARVSVIQGRVAVASDRSGIHPVTLDAGMMLTADDSGRVNASRDAAIDDYAAWTSGRLVFRNTPVSSVVAELGRAYGVDFRVSDTTLATQSVTLTVPVARWSLQETLDLLLLTLDAHSTRSGRTLVIAPGRPATRRHTLPLTENHYGR
jgi:transmembrane sensor